MTSFNPYRNSMFGGPDEAKKRAVWEKATPVYNFDPMTWRLDNNGLFIRFSDYGNRSSEFGWEFDHYPIPNAVGGPDEIWNLRPLHWKANASHGGFLGDLLR